MNNLNGLTCKIHHPALFRTFDVWTHGSAVPLVGGNELQWVRSELKLQVATVVENRYDIGLLRCRQPLCTLRDVGKTSNGPC